MNTHRNCTFPSQYTTGYPPCCPWRRGNVRLSPASQSWSVLLSFAIFQTAIPIRPKHINRRTDRQTDIQTNRCKYFNPTAMFHLLRADIKGVRELVVTHATETFRSTQTSKSAACYSEQTHTGAHWLLPWLHVHVQDTPADPAYRWSWETEVWH